jgi:hypothetical protein
MRAAEAASAGPDPAFEIPERKNMSEAYKGGCACGAVRYDIGSEPVFMNHCQCLDCQRRSGTGHGSYLTFADRRSVKLEGKPARCDVVADSGNVKTHSFCPTCGSPIYLTYEAMPDIITVHAASLDNPARFRPQAVTYAMRGHGWDDLDPTLMKFDKMPPSGS